MSTRPFRLPEPIRRSTKNRTNSLVYNNIRPAIYVSKTGEVGSYSCWNGDYCNLKELNGQIDISQQTEVILSDIEDCICKNPDSFVGISGYDKYDYLNTFYLIHQPDMECEL